MFVHKVLPPLLAGEQVYVQLDGSLGLAGMIMSGKNQKKQGIKVSGRVKSQQMSLEGVQWLVHL